MDGRKEEGLGGGPAPKDMLHLVPSLLDMSAIEGSIEAIACGNQHTVILTSMGTVYTFGRNVDGQLGTTPIFIFQTHFMYIKLTNNHFYCHTSVIIHN